MKTYVFLWFADYGDAESGPMPYEGSSQEIRAVSLEDAWKKLQKTLKLEKKICQGIKRAKKKGKSPNIYYAHLHLAMYGECRIKYSKEYYQVCESSAQDFMAELDAYFNNELICHYKR